MSGFRVELSALTDAAASIDGIVRELTAHPIEDLDGARAAVGHPRLAAAVDEFCDRWHAGVSAMAKDGGQIASRLEETVADYTRADNAAADLMNGALQ